MTRYDAYCPDCGNVVEVCCGDFESVCPLCGGNDQYDLGDILTEIDIDELIDEVEYIDRVNRALTKQ